MTKILLMLGLLAALSTNAQVQRITILVHDVPLKKVIKLIEQKTTYSFVYRTEFLQKAGHVTLHVKNGTIDEAMRQALRGTGLTYLIVGDVITVRKDTTANANAPAHFIIEGHVTNEAGLPMERVSVLNSHSLTGTVTKADGNFVIFDVKPNTVLLFSSVGYESQQLSVKDQSFIRIKLKAQVKDLDETVITGYGKTSKRYNTGSIYKVNQADIARQPVSNPLAALEGRTPGLLITQKNGLPGSTFKVQLRGQSSIGIVPGRLPPNDPLFIIDGVPYAPNNNSLQAISSGSALGESGRSPFSLINPNDIDHIEILKDADATAIYGSRGANGVVLITTKKGKQGPPLFTVDINTGLSNITRPVKMLNTEQYVQMRREALANDGLQADQNNAPDLMVWDNTRYTDFSNMLIGGTAVNNNLQLSLSGGSNRLQYYLSTGYHRETTVFPGALGDNRVSAHIHLHYQSKDSNLHASASVIYTDDMNKSILKDLTPFVMLAPNTPALYDSAGKFNWQQGNVPFTNPMALLLQSYDAKTRNLLGNFDVSYRLFKNLIFKTRLGYNRLQSDEISIIPGASQNPFIITNPKGSSYFGKMIYDSRIIEPQVEYTHYLQKAKLSALVGGTVQIQNNTASSIAATDFSSDAHLKNLNEAGKQTEEKLGTQYRYGGVFARLNGNLHDTYILNLTGRIDGSSRFGPGRQVGTFWAAGAGWIFSNEPFIKNNIRFLSFGKLRSSYGVTGNDQIGDYKYLDQWQKVTAVYQGNTGIVPVQLADSNYNWEVNRKFEAAIDLGLFKERLFISVVWFRNRTGNQLISYTLPALTGFTEYEAKNSQAVVQNTGWEITMQTKNRFSRNLQWNANLCLTIPHNKLLSFPNLASSTYARSLVPGQSLSVLRGYKYKGVNAVTGLFTFEDVDDDGGASYPNDYRVLGNFDPIWYGAIQSNLKYKGWQLDVFWEVRKQKAYNYLYTLYNNNFPGIIQLNQPVMVLDRWQEQGNAAGLQKFTTGANKEATEAMSRFLQSDGVMSDASFWRLRNIELSWTFPQSWLKKLSIKNTRVYMQAQNLFTITPYKGADPETQNILSLPPLKTIAAGVELSF
jgi:TonB-linked SusC/RagA family outer membrane protein